MYLVMDRTIDDCRADYSDFDQIISDSEESLEDYFNFTNECWLEEYRESE